MKAGTLKRAPPGPHPPGPHFFCVWASTFLILSYYPLVLLFFFLYICSCFFLLSFFEIFTFLFLLVFLTFSTNFLFFFLHFFIFPVGRQSKLQTCFQFGRRDLGNYPPLPPSPPNPKKVSSLGREVGNCTLKPQTCLGFGRGGNYLPLPPPKKKNSN